jgi:hypothetical protein
MAEIDAERAALQVRFSDAQSHSKGAGTETEFSDLMKTLEQSQAVINLDLGMLDMLLNSSNTLYATYQQQVEAGTRNPAAYEHDANRLAVETRLYGSFAKRIIYAALSPDGKGLWSYGEVSITLKTASIGHRASLIEENSFDFMRRHRIAVIDPAFPLGYRSNWSDRQLLGSAKLAAKLHQGMAPADLNRLIINSSGDKSLDNFLEIHIFDSFDNRAISGIMHQDVSVLAKDRKKSLLWRGITEKAKKLNIAV